MSHSGPEFSGGSARQAILVMCLGVLCLVLNDACAKWLLDRYSPFQIGFVRGLIGVPVIVFVIVMVRGSATLATATPAIHLIRGALVFGATYAYFAGLRHLPLAEATALIFSAPLFVVAFSAVFLRERTALRSWAAVFAGFAGVLLIVRPGVDAFQPASLLIIAGAMFYALIMIAARRIDPREHFLTMMLYVALIPALLNAFVLFGEWPERAPDDIPVFLALAVLGNLGVALISQAFRMAPSGTVAPFDYTALIWATLIGWLVWHDTPDLWVYAGAAVIIAAGIYTLIPHNRAEK